LFARKIVTLFDKMIENKQISLRHKLRKVDIEIIFNKFDLRQFNKALEIGAGDGFQSKHLKKYTNYLISSDYYSGGLRKIPTIEGIEYKVVDANQLKDVFGEKEFDLIFSSHVLEHIIDIEMVLFAMHSILKADGLMIHVMPNRLWKFIHVFVWYFKYPQRIKNKVLRRQPKRSQTGWKTSGNNPKTDHGTYLHYRIKSFVSPKPHGISKSNFREFLIFGPKHWRTLFINAGFDLVEIKKLQFHTPYRYNFEFGRRLLTKMGLCSSYAYIIRKK